MINVAVITLSLKSGVTWAVEKCRYLVCHLRDPLAQLRPCAIVDVLAAEAVSGFVEFQPGFQLIPEGAKAIEMPHDAHGRPLLCSRLSIVAISWGSIVYIFSRLKE
jgi:hypothetical protein